MCGRYTLTRAERLEGVFPQYRFPKLTPRYNIAPTTPVLALRNTGESQAEFLDWGRLHVNARSETLAAKPAFREPLRLRRAVIFADGYYEWAKGEGTAKQPYFISMPDREPFTFAALWDYWYDANGDARKTCSIVTMNASPEIAWIHHRMPVIVRDEARERWLSSEPLDEPETMALLHPIPLPFRAVPVSTAANKAVRDNDPSLIEEVTPPEQGRLF